MTCDSLLKFHQGTRSPDALTNNLHELVYNIRCTYADNGAVVETRRGVVQRCETVSRPFTERQIDGYRVTYVLDGRRYTMHTDYPPGNRVQVAVNARPVGRWGG